MIPKVYYYFEVPLEGKHKNYIYKIKFKAAEGYCQVRGPVIKSFIHGKFISV